MVHNIRGVAQEGRGLEARADRVVIYFTTCTTRYIMYEVRRRKDEGYRGKGR